MPKHNQFTRGHGGKFSSPYPEKRSQTRCVRFPPNVDNWVENEKIKTGCSVNNLIIEAMELLIEKRKKRD